MPITADNCTHLSVEIVKAIHDAALEEHGGLQGLREDALLHSAVAAPQVTIQGFSPFADLVEVAGAYLFYLCRNHPFIDGNKRAALGACLVFLRLNGLEPSADSQRWTELTYAVADTSIDREETTRRLRPLVRGAAKARRSRGK